MTASPPPRRTSWGLKALRWMLWPIARARPQSVWAGFYRRLTELERSGERLFSPRRLRRVATPRALLTVMLTAAAALWIRDVLHRPAPPEPARLPAPR